MNGTMIYFGNEWERKTWDANHRVAGIPLVSEEPRRHLLRSLFPRLGKRSERPAARTGQRVNPPIQS